MSCSSSSAAKFLLIRVPTYKKGTTTTAIRIRPKVVCSPRCDADTHTHTHAASGHHRDKSVSSWKQRVLCLIPAVMSTDSSQQPLTFLGLGRTAPDDVVTTERCGVTVLRAPPAPVLGTVSRPFLRTDILNRRPRDDAMFPVHKTFVRQQCGKRLEVIFLRIFTCEQQRHRALRKRITINDRQNTTRTVSMIMCELLKKRYIYIFL